MVLPHFLHISAIGTKTIVEVLQRIRQAAIRIVSPDSATRVSRLKHRHSQLLMHHMRLNIPWHQLDERDLHITEKERVSLSRTANADLKASLFQVKSHLRLLEQGVCCGDIKFEQVVSFRGLGIPREVVSITDSILNQVTIVLAHFNNGWVLRGHENDEVLAGEALSDRPIELSPVRFEIASYEYFKRRKLCRKESKRDQHR